MRNNVLLGWLNPVSPKTHLPASFCVGGSLIFQTKLMTNEQSFDVFITWGGGSTSAELNRLLSDTTANEANRKLSRSLANNCTCFSVQASLLSSRCH